MIQQKFSEITISDFELLIENKVPEGRTLEYKAEIKIEKDADKKEFLFDVSSFANAAGGDLIYGIHEGSEKGFPGRLRGIMGSVDEIIRKAENLLRDCISPRVLGIQIKPFRLPDGGNLILIRISKSISAPHQVTFSGVDRFYSRSNNGKYILDVQELRHAFILSETLVDKVRKFVSDRINQIVTGLTPIELLPNAKIILHLIPLSAFENLKIDMSNQVKLREVPIMGPGGWSHRINLDGHLNYPVARSSMQHNSYVQIHRSGILESVSAEILAPYQGRYIPVEDSFSFEKFIIEAFDRYIKFLASQGVTPPIYAFLTLTGISGYQIAASWFRTGNIIDRDQIQLPEIVINSSDVRADLLLKPWFDLIWNAGGFAGSLCYDASGNRVR